MAGRTFAIGDIHGDAVHLFKLMSCLPSLDADDTVVFLGDYVDRGQRSREVVEYVRRLHEQTPAQIVALREAVLAAQVSNPVRDVRASGHAGCEPRSPLTPGAVPRVDLLHLKSK